MGRTMIGVSPAPAGDRDDTVRFSTANAPALALPKVDDRGPRIPRQRGASTVALPADDQELVGLLLNINDTLTNPDVLPAVKDSLRDSLRVLAGSSADANMMGRIQRIIDDNARPLADRIAGVLTAFRCPSWCDDCMPSDTGDSPTHRGTVGEVTVGVAGRVSGTVGVWVERTDCDGVPGRAVVFMTGPREQEMTPDDALRVADLYATAARIAIRDQAQAVAL